MRFVMTLRRRLTVYLVLVSAAGVPLSLAQQPRLTFDVAAVKRVPPNAPPLQMSQAALGGRDHGRYTRKRVPLKVYLQLAFALPPYRVEAPEWMSVERYDILALMPESTSEPDVLKMLQNLLIERFHMKLHWEAKETKGYALVQVKTGAKLKPTMAGTAPDVRIMPFTIMAKNRTLSDLASILMRWTNCPVVNATGLEGAFDFRLDWTPLRSPALEGAAPPSPNLSAVDPLAPLAALSQLGLRAGSRRLTIESLVVESASMDPDEN